MRAQKTDASAKIAILGPSGSGKTFTALKVGCLLGPNPGVIDTERKRALHYADRFAFAHIPQEHFDPEILTRIVIDAAAQGINPLVVDTWSPYWTGAEGMLDQVGRRPRDFDGWRDMRPIERKMVDALCGYPGNVIVNLRVKQEYVMETGDDGKVRPRRVGLKPEQRDGIEYEFDFVFDMDRETLWVAKSMCLELPAGTSMHHPGDDIASTLQSWLRRDALGEPLNPTTVREWAMEPGRTVDELYARRAELVAAGQSSAVVYSPDETVTLSIGDFLNRMASTLKNRAVREPALAAAANGKTTTNGKTHT